MSLLALQPFLAGQLSPLRPDDEEKFYYHCSLLSKDVFGFENNWAYLLQATRNEPSKYEHDGWVVYLTRKDYKNPLSPLVIIHELPTTLVPLVQKEMVVQELAHAAEKVGRKIIVKNVAIEELVRWHQRGFEETTEAWSAFSFRDDNSHPQYVYDLASLNGCLDLHRSHQKNIRSMSRSRSILLSPYETDQAQDAHLLLDEYTKHSSSVQKKDAAEEIWRAHAFFFHDSLKYSLRLMHHEQSHLIALSFLTIIEDRVFYNAIIHRHEKNLMRFLHWQTIRHVVRHYPSARWLIHQGSESAGQDKWKQSFRPIQSIPKTHLTFESVPLREL